tara:strand:+ start:183 stop:1361 length:1179 start_codon:yes stop_codon:yes gene_type:complete
MLGDPYAVLGLDGAATASQIRSAFRARARVLHPDVSDDPSSAALFQELVSAVEAIQAGAKFSKATNVPQVETPPGLSPDQRVAWLVSRNKVILFMLGTKQQPLDASSAMAVSTLSSVAFDTNTRFAACDVSGNAELKAAVLHAARHVGEGSVALPICFIDGTCVGGSDALERMFDGDELMRAFGGEQLVETRELQWEGARLSDEEEAGRIESEQVSRRAHRNLVTGELEWWVLAPENGHWLQENGLRDQWRTKPEERADPHAREQEVRAREERDRAEQREERERAELAGRVVRPADAEAVEPQAAQTAETQLETPLVAEARDEQQPAPNTEVPSPGASKIAAVLAYRHAFGNEQWQVQWAGEEETSWERWDRLDTPALRDAASALRPAEVAE